MDCEKRNLGAVVLMVCVGLSAPAALVAQGTGTKLTASDAAPGRHFGRSVSMDGDYMAIGASGAAYVFRRSGEQWIEQAKLSGPGKRVAISADRIVIGNVGDDEGAPNGGAALVFRREGTKWVEEARLSPSDAEEDDLFGASVAIEGDVIVAGAPGDDDAGLDAGPVYVFRRNGTLWVQEQKLFVSDARMDDGLGGSVAISGDVLIVAARRIHSDASPRKAYIFRRNGTSWLQEQELTATEPQSVLQYAMSVALSGNIAVVGAPSPPPPMTGPAKVRAWPTCTGTMASRGSKKQSLPAAI